jgi:hypothetical protein
MHDIAWGNTQKNTQNKEAPVIVQMAGALCSIPKKRGYIIPPSPKKSKGGAV